MKEKRKLIKMQTGESHASVTVQHNYVYDDFELCLEGHNSMAIPINQTTARLAIAVLQQYLLEDVTRVPIERPSGSVVVDSTCKVVNVEKSKTKKPSKSKLPKAAHELAELFGVDFEATLDSLAGSVCMMAQSKYGGRFNSYQFKAKDKLFQVKAKGNSLTSMVKAMCKEIPKGAKGHTFYFTDVEYRHSVKHDTHTMSIKFYIVPPSKSK